MKFSSFAQLIVVYMSHHLDPCLDYHFSNHPAFSEPDFACFCALLSIRTRLLQFQNVAVLTGLGLKNYIYTLFYLSKKRNLLQSQNSALDVQYQASQNIENSNSKNK